MQQWKDCKDAAGNYIKIWPGDFFEVGENYVNAKGWNGLSVRGTTYNADGTKKFDYDLGK